MNDTPPPGLGAAHGRRESAPGEEAAQELPLSNPGRRIAARDWYRRARVRIREEHQSTSVEPLAVRIFRPGEEVQMVQWGPAGRAPETDMWLTSTDISAAHIVPADKVDVLEVLEGLSPEADA